MFISTFIYPQFLGAQGPKPFPPSYNYDLGNTPGIFTMLITIYD